MTRNVPSDPDRRVARRKLAFPLAVALVVSSLPFVLMPGAVRASGTCGTTGTPSGLTCTYTTAGTDSYTVPAGITQVTFDVDGAQGAGGGYNDPASGGRGGEAKVTLSVSGGDVLQLTIGAAGGYDSNTGDHGGGGASDVRSGSCTSTLSCTLTDRQIVAGGGGGAGACSSISQVYGSCSAGSGGAGAGGNGNGGGSGPNGCGLYGGGGGSSSAGGAGGTSPYSSNPGGAAGTLGSGGNGGGWGNPGGQYVPGGQGGGGYYGGGGGAGGNSNSSCDAAAGGGGSGYVTPSAVAATLATGVRSGGGEITVTALSGTATSTSVGSSANPTTVPASITYTATVSPVPDGGTVQFADAGTTVAGCATQAVNTTTGVATCAVDYQVAGTHDVTADYLGDASYLVSSAALTETLNPAPSTATTLTSSVNPATVRQNITFSATVSPAPDGGTVGFTSNGSAVSGCTTQGVNSTTGVATCSTSYAANSTNAIVATFSGDASYPQSTSSTLTQTVNPAASTTTTLASSKNPATNGDTVTYTATVTPAPVSGTIQFDQNGSAIGTCGAQPLNGSGVATCAYTYSSAGTYTLDAVWAGSADYPASTSSTLTETVSPRTDTVALSSSMPTSSPGQQITYTATVTPNPGSGTMDFTDNGGAICSGVAVNASSGVATCPIVYTTPGTHSIVAAYSGNTLYPANSSSAVTQTVGATNPTYTSPGTYLYTVPSGVTSVTFSTWGAQGGGGSPYSSGHGGGGAGGEASGVFTVIAGDTYEIVVGSAGSFDNNTGESSGGQASDIRSGSCAASLSCTLTARLVVAGGGGGAGACSSYSYPNCFAGGGGSGSGATGANGANGPNGCGIYAGGGGTSSAGGAGGTSPYSSNPGGAAGTLGSGGNGGGWGNPGGQYVPGGQGGAGYYGGGGGAGGNTNSSCDSAGGGGGSGYIDASATSPSTATGVKGGNGEVVITEYTTTSTTVSGSHDPSTYGQSVTLTATVTPSTATGTVQFSVNGTATGSPVAVSGGTATYSLTTMPAGTDTIGADYTASGFYAGSSATASQTVNKATLTVTPSNQTKLYGQADPSFTDTIGGYQNGDGSSSLTTMPNCTVSGTHTNVGNYTITCSGGTASNYVFDDTATANLTINPANTSTALSSSANPSAWGQSVTFTAVVSDSSPSSTGTSTGVVTFYDNGGSLGTGTLNGSGHATLSVSTLSVGTHAITTTYAGDTNFNGSAGTLSGGQVVNKSSSATSVLSAPDPSVWGQTVTFTATVSAASPGAGTPTGTVTFKDGAATIGSASLNGSGVATLSTSSLPVGSHSISASYGGDGNFGTSSGTLSSAQVVNRASSATAITSSPNPSVVGQNVTFTATVSAVGPGAGTPSGTVSFHEGATTLGSATLNASGVATFTTSALAVGSHSITAVYAGDTDFLGSSGTLSSAQVVNQAASSMALTTSSAAAVYGQGVTFTATVTAVSPGSGTPTGTVAFLDGNSVIGAGTLSGGVATFTTSSLSVGSHTIHSSYPGDSSFTGSSASLPSNPENVYPAYTSTAVNSSVNPAVWGQSVTLTATVTATAPGSGVPTGSVIFLDGGSPIAAATLNGSGVASLSTSSLGVGSHTITTSYSGDGNFAGSAGSLSGNPQVVDKDATATATSSSVNPSVWGQPIAFTATVTSLAPGAGTPGGTVTFFDGGSSIGSSTLSGGTATLATSALTVGSHTITARYAGDTDFLGSEGALSGNPQVVSRAASATNVAPQGGTAWAGSPVTITASATAAAPGAGAPSGTMTFMDGAINLGSTPLNGSGVATLTLSTLAVGGHTLSASYSGDGNFTGSSSTTPATVSVGQTLYTSAITTQPTLAGSDGSTWQLMSSSLSVRVPQLSQSVNALVGANADVWTSTAGVNEDMAVCAFANAGASLPATCPAANVVVWKEAGGSGAYSPRPTYANGIMTLDGATTYAVAVYWKANKPTSATIWDGAGPISGNFSASQLTLQLVTGSAALHSSATAPSAQPTLSSSDGSTWWGMSTTPGGAPSLTVSGLSGNGDIAVLGANADLWTSTAGYNQDMAICEFTDVATLPAQCPNANVVVWKEGGGAAPFSPTGALAQGTYTLGSGHTYSFGVYWKAGRSAGGVTIWAGAGASGAHSASRLTVFDTGVPASDPATRVAGTGQPGLGGSNGANWAVMQAGSDDSPISDSITATQNETAVLSANADLWTASAGYNQDIAIFVSDNGGAPQLVTWHESGGYSGTYSPDAVFAESTWQLQQGHTYVFTLEWKSNRLAAGAVIWDGAGPIGGAYSPTGLTVRTVIG